MKFGLLLILPLMATGSILRVQNHKYQRLSVRVTDQVPRHLCQETLNNLEILLTDVSQQLYSWTKKKASFDSINVLLPASWSGTDCLNGRPINDKISLSDHHPDFVISKDHPIFGGDRPITLQYGGCGQQGLGIRIPGKLLLENVTETTKANSFAEWVHYRYGTFSESGFDWDPLYPSVYQSGPSEKVSRSCSNLTLLSRDEQMADASILRNKAICDATTDHYDRDAPTKQNLLCNRQAAVEVMLNHPDLKIPDDISKIRNTESFAINAETEIFTPPTFSYILPTRRRHILVLDLSQAMNIDRQWEMARNALFRFITHIPAGDEVGIVTFGANARINIQPTEVTNTNREGIYGRVPFRLLKGQQGCLECGLLKALELMNTPRSVSNGAVLVLTANSGSSSSKLAEISNLVEELALPINLIAFDSQISQDYTKLTKYGGSYSVNPTNIQQDLADIFMEILNAGRDLNLKIAKSYQRSFSLDNKARHEVVSSGGKRGIAISGNFVVEDNLRSNIWVILTSPYKEDVELFEITSPSGQRKVFPKFENGIVYFYLEGLSEAGIWSYKASLYPADAHKNQVTVEVLAQPTSVNEDIIKVEAWTNVNIEKGASVLDKAVMIYARVTKGSDLPIMNAKVTAKIQSPNSQVPYEVVLTDSGSGYPDITSEDGIYSAYFTGFTTQNGLYSLDIEVTHNEGRATTPSLLNFGSVECCGSVYIPDGLSYPTPTAQFSRYLKSTAFYVTQGLSSSTTPPENTDYYPPSRVSDLSILSYSNNTSHATLVWTAPGGDFDLGMSTSYEIRCYTNAEALSDTNFANMGIPVHDQVPVPGHSGQKQTATVSLPWANEIFYYGLVAVDAWGNRSPVSNLIPVYVEESVNENVDVNDNDVIIESSFSSLARETFGSNENLIYILVGGVLGVVCIISLICIAVFCRAKARKAEEKRKQNARTQIFVNDLEASAVLPDLAPEKPQNYSEVWATHSSALPTNNSPTNSSLEEYANMYMNSSRSTYPAANYPMTTGLPYPSTVPVHEYRTAQIQHYAEDQMQHNSGETPTYQNWTHKPPSDNGTATTSSTECYDDHNSDHSHKNNNNIRVAPLRRYSVDDYMGNSNNLSLSPSFCSSEKRRRQESLV